MTLLRGRQIIVEDNRIDIKSGDKPTNLFDLSRTNKRFRNRLIKALNNTSNSNGTSRMSKSFKLVERTIYRPAAIAKINTNQ